MVVVIDDLIIALLLLYLHWKSMKVVAASVAIISTIMVGFNVKAVGDVVGRGRRGRDVQGWSCLMMRRRRRLLNHKRVWLMILVLWYDYFPCSLFGQCFTKCSMSYETIPPVYLPNNKTIM